VRNSRYLLELRLEKARALVASRSMPLIAIAELCGFSTHAHLSNAFRSRFGVSPSAYRRELYLPLRNQSPPWLAESGCSLLP
jgi:transcriptional regulator GlxA family with amidase domain